MGENSRRADDVIEKAFEVWGPAERFITICYQNTVTWNSRSRKISH